MNPERLQKIKIREQNKDFRQAYFPQPDETETMELIQHIESLEREKVLMADVMKAYEVWRYGNDPDGSADLVIAFEALKEARGESWLRE